VHVRKILTLKGAAVVTIGRSASLAEAAARLRDERVGALVVSDDGVTIDGIVSERDIVRSLASHGASTLGRPVGEAMTSDVLTCRPDDTVDRLMVLMTTQRIRHVPVVDDDGRLAGIVSIGDVVKHRVSELEAENHVLHEYLHQGR
jgi:CBS domain-containing protein